MAHATDIQALRHEYRSEVESGLLGNRIRSAALLFLALQTIVFIPADYIIHPEHFWRFFVARQLENLFLLFVAYYWSKRASVQATVATAITGSTLFLFMVHETGGVESGYYVGLILLLVGIAVLAPLSGRQSAYITGAIGISYALLPWYSHGGQQVNWPAFFQHFFFLGSASIEAWLACVLMDRMRFKDFCQRRQLIQARDELAEMDRVKSRFSANVHHELRTPLTLILAPLESIRSGDYGDLAQEISSAMDTMHANGKRLHKMINNLLDLSKLENSEFQITRRPLILSEVIQELIVAAIPMASRKGVTICADEINENAQIAADREALEKIFVNLLGNALKFTDRGGRIDITTHADPTGVLTRVKDTGIGIRRSSSIRSSTDSPKWTLLRHGDSRAPASGYPLPLRWRGCTEAESGLRAMDREVARR